MKSILVIGLGRFGRHIAAKFMELGNEVMAVDQKEELVNDIADFVTSAQIGDCTNENVLKSLGVNNFDLCVVSMGNHFQQNLEITSLLKDLGAKYVISKVNRDIHGKFLLRNGADVIVYPEREAAERLAVRFSADNLFDYVELTPEYGIFEIPPRADWTDHSISQLAIRVRYHISILAVKVGDAIHPLPNPDYVFTGREHIIVLGRKEDVFRMERR